MDINKGKLLVYILTFAAYAWSGYGSSVLNNLKDAVIHAEGFFGDVIHKLADVVKGVKNINDKVDDSIDEECIFQCENGAKPKPNRYHRPVANGCGPAGMEIPESQYIPIGEMTKCCNDHDICYSTCNRDKDKCDIDFRRCLYKICDKNAGKDSLEAKGCKLTAKLLFTATTALGCSFYLEAQKEACYCQPGRRSDL